MSITMTDTTDTTEQAEGKNAEGATRRRSRLSKTLPTDRISLVKQFDLIAAIPIAYEKVKGPITFAEVAGMMEKMSESTILQASAFLTDTKLISRSEGGRFIPGAELQEFGRVWAFAPEKAWPKLAPLFAVSWFGSELLPRLKLNALDEEDAVHCLAECATAEKDHLPQLRIAIDYLHKVGLIIREGNKIRLAAAVPVEEKKDTPKVDADNKAISRTENTEGLEEHALTLDAKTGKKVVVFGPSTLTKPQLDRLQAWLSFQFIIEEVPPMT